MNIKTNYKIVINEEKQGQELYFEDIPNYNERQELKANGYRWNNAKKCWYKKLNQSGKTEITKTTPNVQNYLGIKVGDIFHYSWGYEQTNANYFQVVALKGKTQVVIREIAYKTIEETAFLSYNVKPCKNEFLESSHFIEDNEKGTIKKVCGTPDGTKYINIESFGFCTLWDGKINYITCYA